MKQKEKKEKIQKYPLTKNRWLWENMKGVRVMFVVAIFGTIAYNILQLTVPFFSSKLVDEFITGDQAGYNLMYNRDRFFLLLGLMVGLTLVRVLIVYLDCMAYEHVSQTVLYRIRNFLYNKIQRQDMKFYSTFRTGDLMTRVTGDLDAVRHMIAWVIRSITESFALYIAAGTYLVIMNWKMALAILAISPFILIVIYRFKKEVGPRHAALREKLAMMNTYAQENISGNRVVKAFAREDYEIEKFDRSNVDFRENNKKTNLTWIKYFPLIETFANLMSVVSLAVGGLFLISGELTMGEYVAFSGLIWAVANPMRNMGNIMNEFQRFDAASDKVMEIYYSEPEIKNHENAIRHPERFDGRVEFKHVSFQYSDGKLPVLRDVSFVAEPGQTVAIMGETGCGKSSLIHMIPRFYEATEGEVLIDGINVQDYNLTDLRKNIGLATQDVLLYSDTIEGNIAYGAIHMPITQVAKFARAACASEFISKMPEGYETIIGERGVGLSGGQKQRISLARALAIEPSILILDDTTSAVDMETEKEIQEALRTLEFPCTKIIIAQRISTTRTADKILVLQDGRISECGTHEELIAKKGYYYDLVQLQIGGEE